ncbi:thiamine-phosphate kinase [Litoribrevibacter albus]|uniref:Thiamine-monophosphate kinase n=1 Tax=Litoribrevibacter albus TaxID=1473156 RepID=A0AA37SFR6_9GAMM|nr:thiamine-phosphate kinase [Litoribrevibacter albus]GLQ33441.1 thiamine-monophosphate kinase [Litoribrevibacter albus]
MDEFALIQTLFQPLQEIGSEENASTGHGFLKKIGDDAAVWKGQGNLAFSIDTLVEGVHFTSDIPPYDLGYRCLAVNLSDLAAMSATPLFYTLAITLPEIHEPWLRAFVDGMRVLAERFHIPLVGGDTTKGPLTITIQAHGLCPHPVYRDGAQVGDDVYVSGSLGDAAAGLHLWLDRDSRSAASTHAHSKDEDFLIQRFHKPTPRIVLGQALSGIASAMLDVSDGLLADLRHIAEASGVSVVVDAQSLPISDALSRCFEMPQANEWALTGGDDYELAFTAPPDMEQKLQAVAKQSGIAITKIGRIETVNDTQKVSVENANVDLTRLGYNHFS